MADNKNDPIRMGYKQTIVPLPELLPRPSKRMAKLLLAAKQNVSSVHKEHMRVMNEIELKEG